MSWLSHPDFPFLAILSWQSVLVAYLACWSCPSLANPSWLFCPGSPLLLAFPGSSSWLLWSSIYFFAEIVTPLKMFIHLIKKKIATWQFPLEILCGLSTAVRVIIAVVIPLEALYYRKPGQFKNVIFYIYGEFRKKTFQWQKSYIYTFIKSRAVKK